MTFLPLGLDLYLKVTSNNLLALPCLFIYCEALLLLCVQSCVWTMGNKPQTSIYPVPNNRVFSNGSGLLRVTQVAFSTTPAKKSGNHLKFTYIQTHTLLPLEFVISNGIES